jgi:hypothetical protein
VVNAALLEQIGERVLPGRLRERTFGHLAIESRLVAAGEEARQGRSRLDHLKEFGLRSYHGFQRNRTVERGQPAAFMLRQTEQVHICQLPMTADKRQIEQISIVHRHGIRPEVVPPP